MVSGAGELGRRREPCKTQVVFGWAHIAVGINVEANARRLDRQTRGPGVRVSVSCADGGGGKAASERVQAKLSCVRHLTSHAHLTTAARPPTPSHPAPSLSLTLFHDTCNPISPPPSPSPPSPPAPRHCRRTSPSWSRPPLRHRHRARRDPSHWLQQRCCAPHHALDCVASPLQCCPRILSSRRCRRRLSPSHTTPATRPRLSLPNNTHHTMTPRTYQGTRTTLAPRRKVS